MIFQNQAQSAVKSLRDLAGRKNSCIRGLFVDGRQSSKGGSRPPFALVLHLVILFLLAGCGPAAQGAPPATQPEAPVVFRPPSATPTVPPAPTQPPLPSATFTSLPSHTPVPSPSPTPLPAAASACRNEAGSTQEEQISSSLLADPLIFRVYLPPCYPRDPQHRYGVLYLLHGLNSEADQWVRLGINITADHMILAGEIPPLIVVMPQDDDDNLPPVDPFGEALVKDLVPWIDSHYRTLPGRDHRAIGGLSRGAGWALHLGLTDWQVFGAIGAHSLPIFMNDSSQLPAMLGQIPSDQLPRIYLDLGINDHQVQDDTAFEAMLTAENVPHEWHVNQGYHNEDYWAGHLEQYLKFYTQGW
jgi:enterochelin esterase-like enzyme